MRHRGPVFGAKDGLALRAADQLADLLVGDVEERLALGTSDANRHGGFR